MCILDAQIYFEFILMESKAEYLAYASRKDVTCRLSPSRLLSKARYTTLISNFILRKALSTIFDSSGLPNAQFCKPHICGTLHAGLGLYSLGALVNHSSTPTSVQVFLGNQIHFRALRSIPPGEEVTIAYIEVISPVSPDSVALDKSLIFIQVLLTNCSCCKCHSGKLSLHSLAAWTDS